METALGVPHECCVVVGSSLPLVAVVMTATLVAAAAMAGWE